MIQSVARIASREVSPGFSYSRLVPMGSAGILVDDYWEIRAATCRTAIEAALPDTAAEIYFNLGPAGRHIFTGCSDQRPAPRAAWVIGPRADTMLLTKETLDCDLVGVRLHAGVAAHVLGVPARDLGGALVDLDQLWGSEVRRIREQLAATSDTRARIGIVEQAILHRLSNGGSGEELGRVRALCRSVGTRTHASVAKVADAFGLSHRRVIALFDQHVGLKPKAYHRVRRLRQVMEAAGSSDHPPWAQVAIQSGFCDQAHMIHEFRRLTGITPREYEQRRMGVGVGFVPYRLAKAG